MNYRPIIESAYNRSDWQGLLHDIFGRRVDFYSPAHRLDVGKALIRQAWFLGAITLADGQKIGIYEAELADGVELERNRVTVRNLLAQEWRGAGFAGAFQFCYKAGSSTLRFSYASETWSFDKDGNFRKESTDTRRFTYFLGEGHRSRTALQQFQELKKSDLTLADITRAFSVEAVSARFFADYKRNYEDIVEYVTGKRMVKSGGKWQEKETGKGDRRILSGFSAFENPEKAVRDYVKKLMGRLVFLQFIQKKGWLGVPKGRAWGEGDREFLQHLFDDHASSTFIDDVLEPLFDDINTRRKGDLANAKLGRNLLVPYLNGGLFEPDGADAADFPLPPEYLRALFDFFGSYNFTIDENDPEDAEVGVDPEMLSRIFENLLEDNKDKGAFYTPKSIVEYMCRESLTAYLQTDRPDAERPLVASFVRTHDAAPLAEDLRTEMLKRLEDVKICDPAIGSGAFPMGLLKELFACRAALGDPCAAHPAELKRRIIESNIYGVDIEKGAVDIARLRFWLALVVDEETPHALPNLDFKIMQGNSLLESYEGVDLSGFARGEKVDRRKKDAKQLMLVFDEKAALGNIQKLLKDFYAVEGHAQKESLQKAIADNVRQYIAQCLGNDKETKKKLGGLRLSNDKFFLWHTWFCDVFNRPGRRGFDIIIGNPPYIKEYVCKAAFDGFREMSPYYMGKMDLWYGFACHGIDMLAPHGQLCFIAQNNWTTSTGAKKMRSKVISDTRIVQMVDFNEYMVFGEDNPDGPQIQTMIMQFEKDTESDEYVFDFRRLASGASRREMRQMLDGEIIPAVIYSSPRVSRAYNQKGVFAFSGDRGVFDKISQGKTFLIDKEIAQGIVPNPDVVNSRNRRNITDQSIETGEGVFVVPYGRFSNLGENETKYIRPLYEPHQMERYRFDTNAQKEILYITKQNWADDAPTLKSHLYKYREIMEQRRENQNGRISYMHLHWPRDEHFFVPGEKILAVRKSVGHPIFAYTTKAAYVMMAVNVIKTNRWDMRYLTGVLNSTLVAYWLRHKGKMQGENYQIDKEPLLAIPLPDIGKLEQLPISDLVSKVLDAKKVDPDADTSAMESEIDALVYKLYGLTDEEIAVVEGRKN